MNRQELIAMLIQLVTGVAVLVGLALVIYELKQTQNLTRIQLASDGYISGMDTLRSGLSESFATTRAKACFEPENLTEAEVFEMFEYHNLRKTVVDRMRIYSNVGDETGSWRLTYKAVMRMMLSTHVGRAQYAYQRRIEIVAEEEVEIVEALIREGIPTCQEEIGRITSDARNKIKLDDLLQ